MKEKIEDLIFEIKYRWAMFYHNKIRPMKRKIDNLKWKLYCRNRDIKRNVKHKFSCLKYNLRYKRGFKKFSFKSKVAWGWMK